MSFLDTLSQMLVIFFAILCGYLARRGGFLDAAGSKQISSLLLNILLPCLILGSVMTGNLPERSAIVSFLGVCGLFFALEILFILTVPRFLPGTPGEKGVWRYMFFFSNVGYVGYPVILRLMGQEGLFYAVILNIPYNLLSYSLGPLLLNGAKRFRWTALRTPGVITSALALVIALGRIPFPAQAGEMFAFVGDVVVPLSLVLLGSLLADLSAGKIFAEPKLWILSAVRLLVMPTALAVLLRALGVGALPLGVAVMEMGMPAAVNGSIMALEFGGDTEAMSALIFLTTLASLVTIPLIAAVLL